MSTIWGWRRRLVGELQGDVLEIGVGEGANLPYYAKAARIWAIEPDPERAARAQTVAAQQRIPITVDVAPAEKLPYDDGAFDVVVSSLVFCSVGDPQLALQEVRRVLRPDGVLQMVEHVRPETKWLAAFFQQITPWWQRVAHNCHLDRPTVELLRAEGWQVERQRRRAMVVRITARPVN